MLLVVCWRPSKLTTCTIMVFKFSNEFQWSTLWQHPRVVEMHAHIILIVHRQNLFTSSYHKQTMQKTEMLRVVAKNSTEAKHPPIYNSIRHDLCLPAVTDTKPRSVWLRDIDLMAEQRNSGDTVRRVPCLLAVEVCTSSDWRLLHCTEI